MNWIFLPLLFVAILLLVIFTAIYGLQRSNKYKGEISKLLALSIKLLELIMRFLNITLFVSMLLLIGIILILIGLLLNSSAPQWMYVFLVFDSVVFSYATPKVIEHSTGWISKLNNSEYTRGFKDSYIKYFERMNFRIVTYIVLLILYGIRNFRDFSKLPNPDILKVSAEALLTFVIIDTVITIYKERKSRKGSPSDMKF